MNVNSLHSRGHSADVRIHLHVHGQILSVAQLGPDFLILRTPADHPPADAQISMSIDGDERRWHVSLPAGIEATQWKTRIACVGESPAATLAS
jgi:hypothetical protein